MDDLAIDRALDHLRSERRRLGIDIDILGAERARREAERAGGARTRSSASDAALTHGCRVLGAKRKSCTRPEHYRFRPTPDIDRTEIPHCSGLLPHHVLSFGHHRKGGRPHPDSEHFSSGPRTAKGRDKRPAFDKLCRDAARHCQTVRSRCTATNRSTCCSVVDVTGATLPHPRCAAVVPNRSWDYML